MRSAPSASGVGGGISGPRALDEEEPADGRNEQSTKGFVSHRTAKNTRALLDWRGAASGTLRFRLLSPSPVSSWKHLGENYSKKYLQSVSTSVNKALPTA